MVFFFFFYDFSPVCPVNGRMGENRSSNSRL
uniref:Uncharacterized protein n=1 Tax=Nelumbo nucifera TaxID=4432 RepID=A0A822YF00_NELNU|nr:TPA_asm: hypothetical protein HUJ06_009843 [Nelumbo nucifera]DAD30999.1 TPA_asm: hypothetical protein HUJ06_009850 [Nelumbo nucifera]